MTIEEDDGGKPESGIACANKSLEILFSQGHKVHLNVLSWKSGLRIITDFIRTIRLKFIDALGQRPAFANETLQDVGKQ